MIYVIATTEVKPGTIGKFIEAMKRNIPLVRQEKGCISYEGTVDYESGFSAQQYNSNRITFVECWESLDALKAHLATPHMQTYREATRDFVVSKTFNVVTPA